LIGYGGEKVLKQLTNQSEYIFYIISVINAQNKKYYLSLVAGLNCKNYQVSQPTLQLPAASFDHVPQGRRL